MASEGNRRSTRTRKPVVSYADEQAEQEQNAVQRAAPKKKNTKKRTIDEVDNGTSVPNSSPPSLDDDDKDNNSAADDSPPTPVIASDSGFESEVETSPVKKRPAKKQKKMTKQQIQDQAMKDGDANAYYGAPPAGTLIPFWGGRMRKQPQLYFQTERKWEAKEKSIDESARWRNERLLASIPKLGFGQVETRLREAPDETPDWYGPALDKALSQKMFVLERSRGIEQSCHANHANCPFEALRIAGSTGNIYEVRIGHLMTCTCPVNVFNRTGEETQCKHVLYVLHNVLKIPEHLQGMPAFLTAELKELFAHAPPLPTDVVNENEKDGNRKAVEGDCPICFTNFDEDESIVWCKAACGNNIHKKCFDAWAKNKNHVTCPFCRTPWASDEQQSKHTMAQVKATDQRDRGGYVNVRDRLAYD